MTIIRAAEANAMHIQSGTEKPVESVLLFKNLKKPAEAALKPLCSLPFAKLPLMLILNDCWPAEEKNVIVVAVVGFVVVVVVVAAVVVVVASVVVAFVVGALKY
jgi:hypothetical protein